MIAPMIVYKKGVVGGVEEEQDSFPEWIGGGGGGLGSFGLLGEVCRNPRAGFFPPLLRKLIQSAEKQKSKKSKETSMRIVWGVGRWVLWGVLVVVCVRLP